MLKTKTFLSLLLPAIFFSLGAAEKSVTAPPPPLSELKKTATKTSQAKSNKRFHDLKEAKLENPDSWTMIVVPDTQGYIRRIQNHGILDMMFAWMVNNKKNLNIRQVLFTGDLVDKNHTAKIKHDNNDLVCQEQWKAFSRIIERLDGRIPYVLCTGNHDYGANSAENRTTHFNEYFPCSRNTLTREQLLECGPNTLRSRSLENAVYEFTAPAPDKRKFLVITLQFAPTEGLVSWAKTVVDSPEFSDHFVILLTHSYMRSNGELIKDERYAINQKYGGKSGEYIFKNLVYPAKNIRMVICGHVCAPNDWSKSVGFAMTKNSSGKSIAQMVFNTQAVGGGFAGSGGDGWLRLLEFMPDRKTIKARTYSPFFAASPSTCSLAWKDDSRNEFSFELE